jgi:hypothetical protein
MRQLSRIGSELAQRWKLTGAVVVLVAAIALTVGPATANRYGSVERAAGWTGTLGCAQILVRHLATPFSRWAGPQANAVDLDCEMTGPNLDYASFPDADAVRRALRRARAPEPLCTVGSVVVGDDGASEADVFIPMCAKLGGRLER